MNVLLMEDDMVLSEIITEYLETLGYQVHVTYNGIEAEDLVYTSKFDLLLLDVNVPHLDGFSFLKSFRGTGAQTPAIFITSLHDSRDVLEGFEVGCDDYLKKPFDLLELKARIENIKRHFHIDEKVIFEISDTLSYDSGIQTLFVDTIAHKLPKKEAEILEYLLHHKTDTVKTEDLIANLWSYEDAPTMATIRTYIKNLRKLLGEEKIMTIKGVGYRFND
ncbi:MAG: response regulator transcription factor [Epsilonproteobacteria bacterium]|nr:response regulator transcription factor [Campylobacterota bacterium]